MFVNNIVLPFPLPCNSVTTAKQSAFACSVFRSQALILSTQVSPAQPPFLTGSTGWVKKLWLANNTQLRLKKFAHPPITMCLVIAMEHITVCSHPVLHAPPTTPSAAAAVSLRPWNNCLSCFSSYSPLAVREREGK